MTMFKLNWLNCTEVASAFRRIFKANNIKKIKEGILKQQAASAF